jgi:hypothetical protein
LGGYRPFAGVWGDKDEDFWGGSELAGGDASVVDVVGVGGGSAGGFDGGGELAAVIGGVVDEVDEDVGERGFEDAAGLVGVADGAGEVGGGVGGEGEHFFVGGGEEGTSGGDGVGRPEILGDGVFAADAGEPDLLGGDEVAEEMEDAVVGGGGVWVWSGKGGEEFGVGPVVVLGEGVEVGMHEGLRWVEGASCYMHGAVNGKRDERMWNWMGVP